MNISIDKLFQKAKSKKLPGVRYEDNEGEVTLRCNPQTVYLQSAEKRYSISYIGYKEWEDVVFYLAGVDADGRKEFFKIFDEKYLVEYCTQ